jgi:uracil-DNA glycosylase
MEVRIEPSWQKILQTEFDQPYFEQLVKFVKEEYATQTIFPPAGQIFNAFNSCPFSDVRVVILGQDPYHEEGQAMGLSFSVPDGVKIPPSLVNIYKEINNDLGYNIPNHGDLTKWAKQGVLLLNSVLTVVKDTPGSHRGKGWEIFTDEVIKTVNDKTTPVVFLLWGNYAKEKKKLITNPIHLVLESSHPSPFSVRNGFDGCSHFSKANNFLSKNNIEPIDWQIDNI